MIVACMAWTDWVVKNELKIKKAMLCALWFLIECSNQIEFEIVYSKMNEK